MPRVFGRSFICVWERFGFGGRGVERSGKIRWYFVGKKGERAVV